MINKRNLRVMRFDQIFGKIFILEKPVYGNPVVVHFVNIPFKSWIQLCTLPQFICDAHKFDVLRISRWKWIIHHPYTLCSEFCRRHHRRCFYPVELKQERKKNVWTEQTKHDQSTPTKRFPPSQWGYKQKTKNKNLNTR